MSEELIGNCLVVHTGTATSVANASILGIVSEALNHEEIEEIYGGLNGLPGVLAEEIIDLAEQSQQAIRGLRHTPGSALGSNHAILKRPSEFERLQRVLEAHNIRFMFLVGGPEALEPASRIIAQSEERGYALRLIVVPKSVENELPTTDHCPGYASAVKLLATTVREAALDAAATAQHDHLTLIETNARTSGWLAAGGTMAKRRDHIVDDPPHLVYLPEVPFSIDNFYGHIQQVLKKHRFCIAVLDEGLVDTNGNFLTQGSLAEAIGQPIAGSCGEALARLAADNMGITTRTIRLGVASHVASHCASETDADEAVRAGAAAVEAALQWQSAKMITLLRGDSENYACRTGLTDLAELGEKRKNLPENWINEDGVSLAFQFYKYCLPLIQGEAQLPYDGGLPHFVEFERVRVARELEPYDPS
jgi:6-phosphofructokinase 1